MVLRVRNTFVIEVKNRKRENIVREGERERERGGGGGLGEGERVSEG